MKKYCIFYKCKNRNAVNHAVTGSRRRRRYFTFDEAAVFIKQRENGANGYTYWITTTTTGAPVDTPAPEDLAASGVYRYHHTAARRGYESRRGSGRVLPYSGRFGRGYIHITPRADSSRYVDYNYYLEV